MFVTFFIFFPTRPAGHTLKPIFMQNVSNDVDPRIDVPFAVKIETFSNPLIPGPENLALWGRD